MSNAPTAPLTGAPLAAALRRYADGNGPVAAAVALLVVHAAWLDRPEFVRWCVVVSGPAGDEYAALQWTGLSRFLIYRPVGASSSEWALLGVVHELGDGALARAAWTADDRNRQLVLGCVAAALGLRELPPLYADAAPATTDH